MTEVNGIHVSKKETASREVTVRLSAVQNEKERPGCPAAYPEATAEMKVAGFPENERFEIERWPGGGGCKGGGGGGSGDIAIECNDPVQRSSISGVVVLRPILGFGPDVDRPVVGIDCSVKGLTGKGL